MRRSAYIQPSFHNQQAIIADEQRKEEEMESPNLREKRMPSPASSQGGAEKKLEAPETKKQPERKPTEDINASADAFIKNFRQQLMIQRLQSMENYEQMLARGL